MPFYFFLNIFGKEILETKHSIQNFSIQTIPQRLCWPINERSKINTEKRPNSLSWSSNFEGENAKQCRAAARNPYDVRKDV